MAKLRLDMWKAHELSFGQIDPPRLSGGYAVKGGLNYVPRINAAQRIDAIMAFRITPDGRVVPVKK